MEVLEVATGRLAWDDQEDRKSQSVQMGSKPKSYWALAF